MILCFIVHSCFCIMVTKSSFPGNNSPQPLFIVFPISATCIYTPTYSTRAKICTSALQGEEPWGSSHVYSPHQHFKHQLESESSARYTPPRQINVHTSFSVPTMLIQTQPLTVVMLHKTFLCCSMVKEGPW